MPIRWCIQQVCFSAILILPRCLYRACTVYFQCCLQFGLEILARLGPTFVKNSLLQKLHVSKLTHRLIERLRARCPQAAAAAEAAQLAIGPWHLLPHRARCALGTLVSSSFTQAFYKDAVHAMHDCSMSQSLVLHLQIQVSCIVQCSAQERP